MNKIRKVPDIRLLPVVICVAAVVLVLKATGLGFPATAAEPGAATPAVAAAAGANAQTPGTNAPKPAAAKLPSGATDPTAAIAAAMPIPTKPGAASPAGTTPPDSDLSPELTGAGVSPAEMDVLSRLSDRRTALDERERALQLRANLIQAAEKRVADKIGELKTLQTQIEALLGQRDDKETAQIDALVKVYSAMKGKDAARIFANLDDKVRIDVASRMKSDAMASIMAALPADVAQKLTVELANHFKLPADNVSMATASASGPTQAMAGLAAPAPQAGADISANSAANPSQMASAQPNGAIAPPTTTPAAPTPASAQTAKATPAAPAPPPTAKAAPAATTPTPSPPAKP